MEKDLEIEKLKLEIEKLKLENSKKDDDKVVKVESFTDSMNRIGLYIGLTFAFLYFLAHVAAGNFGG
ncbi:hypothetical protein [Aliarcobacter skirrowii]|uniref:hypothetical protein n=1 Tax=Aliarcobacter skirrowii TaxID=28200 RepID=UPI00082C4BA6|nr:hypothetical protein [Aliarcobacter skirrowii]